MVEIFARDKTKYRDRRSLKMKEYGFNVAVSKKVPSHLRALFEQNEYILRTNGLGFIENGNGIRSSNRICVMGDSFSECPLMEEKERFVSVCERELNALGHDIELLNSSMTGMNIFHAIFIVLTKILPFGVSKIIYFTSNSDYQTSRMTDGDFFTQNKNYSIFNIKENIEERERENSVERKENVERGRPVYGNYNRLLNVLYTICKTAKIELIFALRPFGDDDRRGRINTITENFAAKRGIRCISFRNFKCENIFYDNTHLTRDASVKLGKYFAFGLYDMLMNESKNMGTSFKIEGNPFIFDTFYPARVLKLKEWPAMAHIVKKTLGTVDEPFWGDSTFILDTNENSFSENANGIHTDNKIIVIGGSFIECLFMKPEERLLSVAERALRDIYHCEIELVNSSTGGTNILHAICAFLAKIAPMKPSIILYSPAMNDYRALCSPGAFYTIYKRFSLFETKYRNIDERVAPQYKFYTFYLRLFYEICKIYGHRLIFVLRPFCDRSSVDMLNRITMNFCSKRNIGYIDLREFANEEVIKWHYDGTHLLPEGAQMVGNLLAKKLYEAVLSKTNSQLP